MSTPAAAATDDPERWLTVRSAAVRMDVKEWVIRDWIRRGHLPALRHAHRVVVNLDDLFDAERKARRQDRTGTARRRKPAHG